MSTRRWLALSGVLLLGGCVYHVRERADEAVCALAAHPYDLLPARTEPITPEGQTAAASTPAKKPATAPEPALDVQTAAYMGTASQPDQPPGRKRKEPQIPPEIPGSEAKMYKLPHVPPAGAPPQEKEAYTRAVQRLYPELPSLPPEPTPLPGPNGQPYTLADLQQIAAVNSPELRQATADVEAAHRQPAADVSHLAH